MQKIIFTYGVHYYQPNRIIAIAQQFHVNCIINISGEENSQIASDIRKHNILYSCFWQYFEGIIPHISDAKAHISQDKAIHNDTFLQGIERIKKGIEQGYTIMLIDHTPDTSHSIRYTLLGKILSTHYNVTHIITPIHFLTQQQLEDNITKEKEERLIKKRDAAKVGEAGEEIAGLYLMQQHFRILHHNWNLHKGCEIDIIAFKDNKLHFIEVKTRTSLKYGAPETAITAQKMRNIRKAAIEYRYRFHMTHLDFQIDSIAIIYRSNTDYDLKYYPDIQQYATSKNYNTTYHNH